MASAARIVDQAVRSGGADALRLAGRHVVVLGLGETGVSTARWLHAQGARVSVADTRSNPPGLESLRAAMPECEIRLGGFQAGLLAAADLVAISPGIPLSDPAVAGAISAGVPVVGDVELFARAARREASKVVAITGTNGKSTVTALVGAMCKRAALDTEVAGNISPAILDALARRESAGTMPEAWVLELSSFQLETTSSLAPDAAAVLNVSEDHLDRYASIESYAAAKSRILEHARVQILNRDDPRTLAMSRPGREAITFGLGIADKDTDFGLVRVSGDIWLARGTTPLLRVADMQLAGLHNAANALAALAIARSIGLALSPSIAALQDFRGLPHRVELVREDGGIRWYDDSKGTNVGSTVAALNGLAAGDAKVVLIAGGDGKSQDFAPLKAAVKAAARCVILIGRDAPDIERAIDGSGVAIRYATTMDEAVTMASVEAKHGDAVLLSPACASFDMYRDYLHRAEVFRTAVQGIHRGR